MRLVDRFSSSIYPSRRPVEHSLRPSFPKPLLFRRSSSQQTSDCHLRVVPILDSSRLETHPSSIIGTRGSYILAAFMVDHSSLVSSPSRSSSVFYTSSFRCRPGVAASIVSVSNRKGSLYHRRLRADSIASLPLVQHRPLSPRF